VRWATSRGRYSRGGRWAARTLGLVRSAQAHLTDDREHARLAFDQFHDDTTALFYPLRGHVLRASLAQVGDMMGDLVRNVGTSDDERRYRKQIADLQAQFKDRGSPPDNVHEVTRTVMLRVLDQRWCTYLAEPATRLWPAAPDLSPDEAFAEYRRLATAAFDELLTRVRRDVLLYILHVEVDINTPETPPAKAPPADDEPKTLAEQPALLIRRALDREDRPNDPGGHRS
jgi:preprotein translocase subunit SecA